MPSDNDFLGDNSDWTEIGQALFDGQIAVYVYSNPCPAPEHKGLYHVMADVVDYRSPKYPVQVNSVPVAMPQYTDDGHYFAEDLEAVAADFLYNVGKARAEAGNYAAFVRGLYVAPFAELLEGVMSMAKLAGLGDGNNGLGGSQDDVDATDLMGGFDLNSILH